jgi:hypothetical protein
MCQNWPNLVTLTLTHNGRKFAQSGHPGHHNVCCDNRTVSAVSPELSTKKVLKMLLRVILLVSHF